MLSTIRLSSKGDLVKVAQYLIGYAARKQANEIYDQNFVNAVKTWQKKNDLSADGIIGSKSWTKMAELAPTCSTSKNKKSAYTCAIQILLGGLEVDGDYGTKTKQAVAAFQTASKLLVDGICGRNTWKALILGAEESSGTGAGQTTSGTLVMNNCVKYLQWDSRWKKVKYSTHTSSQTIGNSGCGPTSMAMVVATFIDKNITPVEMCKLSVDNGYRTYSNGTSWSFFKFVFKKYPGFRKYVETSSIATVQSALKEGALAICSMNSNDNKFWTSGGYR